VKLFIETNQLCGLDCDYCLRPGWAPMRKVMHPDLFERILADVHKRFDSLEVICLYGISSSELDPILDERIYEIMRIFGEEQEIELNRTIALGRWKATAGYHATGERCTVLRPIPGEPWWYNTPRKRKITPCEWDAGSLCIRWNGEIVTCLSTKQRSVDFFSVACPVNLVDLWRAHRQRFDKCKRCEGRVF
jgi:MoaA/NifB/PqqE/SkfB family radical SAM enzyme